MEHAVFCPKMPSVAAGATRKRKRVAAVGSAEEYEEACRLDFGGFGVVVKARHRATGESVAIKRLTEPDDGGRGEVLREARFLEALDGHPFVVGFHGLVRDPVTNDLCLIMECPGPTLSGLLRRRGPLPEAAARAVMRQLLEAVNAMHALHIIHRDIKTDNILVGEGGGVVKICDLGSAMCMTEAPPYEPEGTLWYKAPEMLLEKPDYDALVDAWSLGCVMAELLTGRELFDTGRNEEGRLRAIFDVVGMPDDATWPGFSSTWFADEVLPLLDAEEISHRGNHLRELFPEATLSEQGFEVLSGLLACHPDKRLTVAAALKHPWFAQVDDPLDLLALPTNEASASSSSSSSASSSAST